VRRDNVVECGRHLRIHRADGFRLGVQQTWYEGLTEAAIRLVQGDDLVCCRAVAVARCAAAGQAGDIRRHRAVEVAVVDVAHTEHPADIVDGVPTISR
jgi:hypothetical protein